MEAVIDAIDDDTDPGFIEIGDGTPPALGNVLVRLPLNRPSFVTSVAGSVVKIDMSVTPAISADATAAGTASSARICDGADNAVVTGLTVGTAAPAEIRLNALAISAGQTVSLQSGEITHG